MDVYNTQAKIFQKCFMRKEINKSALLDLKDLHNRDDYVYKKHSTGPFKHQEPTLSVFMS